MVSLRTMSRKGQRFGSTTPNKKDKAQRDVPNIRFPALSSLRVINDFILVMLVVGDNENKPMLRGLQCRVGLNCVEITMSA